jgi:hypothetical protein
MMDKTREGVFVETARKLYPWFPSGEIGDYEKPDILLVDGDDRIGIEVTELFQPPKHGSKFGPHVVATFHQRVMEIAERGAKSLPPCDVLVYFEYRDHLNDPELCAEALIDFVRTHTCGTYHKLDSIPHGFGVVRIAEPIANAVPRWRCADPGSTVEATCEILAAVIAAKTSWFHRTA